MTGTKITVRPFGFPSYVKKLNKLGADLSELDDAFKETETVAKAAVKSYPPYGNWEQGEISFTKTRPGSKYKRTSALGKGWKGRHTVTSKMHKYTVWHQHPTSSAYYPYVMGSEQTTVHRPWWITTSEWPERLQPVILKIFRRHMKAILIRFK